MARPKKEPFQVGLLWDYATEAEAAEAFMTQAQRDQRDLAEHRARKVKQSAAGKQNRVGKIKDTSTSAADVEKCHDEYVARHGKEAGWKKHCCAQLDMSLYALNNLIK